ncbi:MAG TPA: enoyl-CoA hydratase-related protein [Asanoa sp.]|nr:enoyl-CoA hydratase-related protein [Asanoa sp.]
MSTASTRWNRVSRRPLADVLDELRTAHTLTFEQQGPGILVMAVNRPHRANSQTVEMFGEIAWAAATLRNAPLRALIVTGAGGKAFCTGFDLDEVEIITKLSVAEFTDLVETAAAGSTGLRALPYPVIAAVSGPAAGGGLSLALAADIRIADPDEARAETRSLEPGPSDRAGPSVRAGVHRTHRAGCRGEADRAGRPAHRNRDRPRDCDRARRSHNGQFRGRRPVHEERVGPQSGEQLIQVGAGDGHPRTGTGGTGVDDHQRSGGPAGRGSVTAAREQDTGLRPTDDLRHRPVAGERTRDSLFWELIMPEHELGVQVYLYLTGSGKAGYNVCVWGPDARPLALHMHSGQIPDHADLDEFAFEGLTLTQPELRKSCLMTYDRDGVRIEFAFNGIHDAFSYHSNPDGLPSWFAVNRIEQTGRVRGGIEVAGRRMEWDRMGHRDHSWGVRDSGVPQHWKWFVAYTESGRAVNGWIWIAKGEWGFAGYVVRDGVTYPIRHIDQHAEYGEQMRQRRLRATLTDVTGTRTELELDVFGVIELPTHDRLQTVIREGACRATIDGEQGAGQFETHWQGSYLDYLSAQGT